MVAVTDSGHGIDAATQKRLFEPFFTTKPKGRGTGLGLATVYGAVKQAGGHIFVYSEVGRGSTFKVYLPRTTEDPVAQSEAPPSGDCASLAGCETVILVEDEDAVRRFGHAVLSQRGYTVNGFADPDSALEFARATSEPVDLIVTDIVLPGMNGRVMAARLRERHPESQVLYMSGYADEAIVRHGVLEPGTHFLQKPFNGDDLARAVRDTLTTRRETVTRS
jgi:CheY-like chemotaxis protein